MELDVIYQADALTALRGMKDETVDCIVTSPPYWQLRDYGLEPVLFGGESGCRHKLDKYRTCTLCGGWMGQLGHEPVREMFVDHLVMVFDECRRVLKNTGTLWVNIGDSYSKPNKIAELKKGLNISHAPFRIRPKSLSNIPGLFAERMIGSGWILRNEIIWHKPSAIPASVHDRFTVDFEKLFFFTKSERYYFEQQFVPYAESTYGRYRRIHTDNGKNRIYREQYGAPLGKMYLNPKGRNMRTVWKIPTASSRYAHFASFPSQIVETPVKAGCPEGGVVLDPFMGSGTTALVARDLGRHYIGIEPNPEYVAIIRERLSNNR